MMNRISSYSRFANVVVEMIRRVRKILSYIVDLVRSKIVLQSCYECLGQNIMTYFIRGSQLLKSRLIFF